MGAVALVLAAGRGERLGADVPKAFVSLAGTPLVVRSLHAIASVPEIDRVVPVVAEADLDRFQGLDLRPVSHRDKLATPVIGGVERQDSVRSGLRALGDSDEFVAVHDAARCLVSPADVSRAIAVARDCGAALLAEPARDTIKRVTGGRVVETPNRAECWVAQTPQIFRTDLLREAVEKAHAEGFRATDDAQLVERLGVEVRVVLGNRRNIKVTSPEDLVIAEAWLREQGSGSERKGARSS